jgi:predicted xylose isomerase-like sugar epimerase
VLTTQEIGLRFNNWDRVRGQRLPLLLFYAAACGAGVILVLVIATGRLAYREERGA